MNHATIIALGLALATASAASQAGEAVTYGGVTVGNSALDEVGNYGASGLGFGSPTLAHDVCGGTATITIGAEPTVQRIDGSATSYRFFIGRRWGDLALEFGRYNVSRIESSATVAGYSVAQPSCTSGSFTVSAEGVKLESLQYHGWTLTPVWIRPLAADWELELRATVATWNREARSQWQVVVTEYDAGDFAGSGAIAADYARLGDEDIDVGFGVGIAWRATETVRLRALIEDQVFGPQRIRSTSLGLVVDF